MRNCTTIICDQMELGILQQHNAMEPVLFFVLCENDIACSCCARQSKLKSEVVFIETDADVT
jgi:hypothetical protein